MIRFDEDMLNDAYNKLNLAKFLISISSDVKVNLDFNLNSLDLSCYFEDLTLIDCIIPEITMDDLMTITEADAARLGLNINYTDEDIEEDRVEGANYSNISTKYINEFLKIMKVHNIPVSLLNNALNHYLDCSEYNYCMEVLLLNGYEGLYLLTECIISIDNFMWILEHIINFHLYCKKVVKDYYSGKEIIINNLKYTDDFNKNFLDRNWYLETYYEFKIRCKPKSKLKKYTKVKIISKPIRFRRKAIKNFSNKNLYMNSFNRKYLILRREYFKENGYKWCKRIKNIA